MQILEILTYLGEWLISQMAIFVAIMILPLLLIARIKRAYPSRRLLFLVALPAIGTLFLVVTPQLRNPILIADLVLVCVAAVDIFRLSGRKKFGAERKILRVASLNKPHQVEVIVRNNSDSNAKIIVADDLPAGCEAEPSEFFQTIRRRSAISLKYSMRVLERGRFLMHKVYLRVNSPWELWKGIYRINCESEVHVYPDLKQLMEYSILARTNQLSQFGVRKTRKIGQDNDFERLRDYNLDDNFKFIDWRATSRRQKLTVRDFQANQSQRVIFMIDCGRMMTNQKEGLTLLDHALNSALMLSHVALMRGDAVGMLFFNSRVLAYVPPKSGKAQMNHLLHAAFDRHPEYVESRYDEAFVYLRTRCLKRSLVVLLTSVIDEINANQVQRYLSSIAGRHLPIAVLMRDHQMWQPLEDFERDSSKLFEAAAAAEILAWRHEVLLQLNRSGVLSVDVFPDQLTAPLINRYLEIKARHLL